MWVIDLRFTRPGNHVLRDLAKLFACVMFNNTSIASDLELAQAVHMVESMCRMNDLQQQLPNMPNIGSHSLSQA